MKLKFLLGSLCAAVVLTSCCAPCRAYQKQRRPLVGTSWQLIQLRGEKFVAEPGQYTLQFTPEGEVVGLGACNRVMGNYVTTERRDLKIGPLATTRMRCKDAREGEFFAQLEQVTHYDMDGPMMMLLSDGFLVAVMEAQPAE